MNAISHAFSPARVDVARRINHILRGRCPGTVKYEIGEKALSLVFNAARPDDQYLLRNVWRDAHRSLKRSEKRCPERADLELGELAVSDASPEDVLIEKESLAEIERIVREHLHPDALLCLPGLLRQETPKESSVSTGLPVRRVKYLRERIRACVARALGLLSPISLKRRTPITHGGGRKKKENQS